MMVYNKLIIIQKGAVMIRVRSYHENYLKRLRKPMEKFHLFILYPGRVVINRVAMNIQNNPQRISCFTLKAKNVEITKRAKRVTLHKNYLLSLAQVKFPTMRMVFYGLNFSGELIRLIMDLLRLPHALLPVSFPSEVYTCYQFPKLFTFICNISYYNQFSLKFGGQ